MAQFIDKPTKTVELEIDGVAAGLESAGLISRSTDLITPIPGGLLADYSIKPWVYSKLSANPDLVKLPDDYEPHSSMNEWNKDDV